MHRRPVLFLKLSVVVGIIFILSFYFFHQSRAYFVGPRIQVTSPQNSQVLNKSWVLIRGRALNAARLLIDGREVLTDSFGYFEHGLLLARGYNIIELTAEDKFNRVAIKKLELVLK
jgi:hypothetical protein